MNTILMSLIIMTMTYEMPKLPYANNALEPVISQQTIDFHYGKHLQTYVNNLNSLVPGTEYEGKTVRRNRCRRSRWSYLQQRRPSVESQFIFPPIRLRNLRKRNRQANWEKPSNVISAALKTSRRSSMQQQSDCSVQDGLGCQ